MANERNLELLDDYIANRMSDTDRSAFEQKLNADPNLHQEYVLQERLIRGIKDARVAQLKSMLNQVPVPSQSPGNAIASKVVIGTVVTLMIAAAAYWFVKTDQNEAPQESPQQTEQHLSEDNALSPASEDPGEVIGKEEEPVIKEQQVQETDKNQTSAGTEHSKPSLAKKPDPLAAPTAKDKTEETVNGDAAAAKIPVSIERQSPNDAYNFHYQYRDGKITLYGPFEGSDYQVIEMPVSGKRAAFLYYGSRYYSLENGNTEIKPLIPVGDAGVVRKLEEHRRSQ